MNKVQILYDKLPLQEGQVAGIEIAEAEAEIGKLEDGVVKAFDPNQPRDKDGKFTVYHSTSLAAAKRIAKEGLVIGVGKRTFSWDNTLYEGERGESIYVTSKFDRAMFYAGELSRYNKKKISVILKITVPKDDLKSFVDDETDSSSLRTTRNIKPEWITGAYRRNDDEGFFDEEDKWEPISLNKAVGDETFYIVIDANEYSKAFDPNQSRDERGRWSSSGSGSGGDIPDGGLKHYLTMITEMEGELPGGRRSINKFILGNGQAMATDEKSWTQGTPHQCYMNAFQAATADRGLTYVEGYVSVHGVPIHHAWTTDSSGKVRDVTIGNPAGILGYYGVKIKDKYLMRTALKTKVYGVLVHSNRSILTDKVEDVVEK